MLPRQKEIVISIGKLLLVGFLVTVFASSARGQTGTYIQNVTPSPTAVGVQETVKGINFGSTQGSSTVKFGSLTASVYQWQSNQITVSVPNITGSVSVTVTVNGHTSNAYPVTVQPDPTVSSVSPSSGPVGTVVTITGQHFGAAQATYSAIYFGRTLATPTSWSDTQIVVPVPSGAPAGSITLYVEIGIGSLIYGMGEPFQVPPPVITNVSPNSGIAGTPITISGSGFGPTQGSSTVVFETATAAPTSWSATSIVAPVPSGATPGPITVTVGGVSASVAFTSIPNITSLSPTSGPVQTSVTISGTGFGATQAGSILTFNGITATPTSWNTTTIKAPVPNGATTGSVVVTEGVAASNGPTFTVTGANPSVGSLSPTSGYVGTSVTITGTNFGSSQGTSTVKFNGTLTTPTNWSASSITAPVPNGATTGSVVITVSGVPSNGVVFSVLHSNLLIGSSSGDSSSSTFESYDDTAALLQQGTLATSRSQHTATLLNNGTVFVAGGVQAPGTWAILNVNGQLLSSGNLLNGFYGHFAVLLANGNVFLGGGTIAPGTWEIRSPSGASVSSGSLLGARTPGAGALLLQNGNVWIVGAAPGPPGVGSSDYCSWEIHGSDGSLLSNGTLATCFGSRQVFTLSNGNIIFLGGVDTPGQYDIYTQAGALIRSGTLRDGFDGNAGSALVGNNILLLEHGYWEYLGFDANSNTTFDNVGSLFDQRQSSGVVVTSTGNIFITGGDATPGTWEMYTPNGTTVTLSGHGPLFDTRGGGHTLTHF